MRNRSNQIVLSLIAALTVFAVIAVWPGSPERYLPDFVPWPDGSGIHIGGVERRAMRLGLDLKGGSYVLLEADCTRLPSGVTCDDALESAREVVERRINAFGVAETEISREGRDRLSVQLPGISPEQARELIGKTAELEFRQPKFDEARNIICRAADGSEFAVPPGGVATLPEPGGKRVAQCATVEGTTGEVIWEPATGTTKGVTRALTGSFLRPNARIGTGPFDCGDSPPPCVAIEFSSQGGDLFQQITERLGLGQGSPLNLPLGIFLDGDLVSAPIVNEPITGGRSIISGLDLEEAKTLRIQLNAGALPVPLRAIQETEVDATLGEDTLVRSVQAGLIGVLAVMAFMILYYRLPGVLASLALVTYISTVMMVFKLFPGAPITITLAGIAGFVLSVGMAVDANILVFERLKEELRAGRNLAAAIEHGFDRAWSSIRDSNVSTLITCIILFWFGDQFGASLVKGFAVTLAIGVLVSMFSAIVVTRTFLRLLVGSGAIRHPWLLGAEAPGARPVGAAAEAVPDGLPRRGGGSPSALDFVKRRRFYYLLSAAVLVPGVISLLVPPSLKPGIEFSSGATFTVSFEDPEVTQDDLRSALAGLGHGEARVQKTSGGSFIVRTRQLAGPSGPPVGPAPPSERDTLEEGLVERFGPLVDGQGQATNAFQNFSQVSEIVSRQIGRNAAIAVGAAAVAILLYISWAFRHVPKAYRYGIAAVVATMHDAVFVLGAFSIFGKVFDTEINTMFITGLLTVIGFSVHDTIVVFDRIRENVGRYPGVPFDEVVNASLTETVGRSINTSTTVLITIMALLLLGGATIESFLLVLLIGVIAGTYSSIFVASQIVVSWEDGDFDRLFRRVFPRRPVPVEA